MDPRGSEPEGSRGADGARSPAEPQSPGQRSALSLYDNLSDGETGFPEPPYEPAYKPRASRRIGGPTAGGAGDGNPWRSPENALAGGTDQNPDLASDPGTGGFIREGRFAPRRVSPVQAELLDRVPWNRTGDPGPEQRLSHAKAPPPPLPLVDPSARALRSILTNLQQQIVRQQDKYEAQIISLEQRNKELQAEVVRLKTNLAQQRLWYENVQDKIRECERDRAAAEVRNSALQKDMDQFFDTFGELTNEAKKTEYIVKSF